MKHRKYELTDITMEFYGRTLYRIRALRDFSDVKKGELGGWVSSEYNLSQYGNCWVYNNAMCMDNSRMFDNSKMYNGSRMFGSSRMHDDSVMFGNSAMFGSSKLKDKEKLHGKLVSKVDNFIDINNKKGRMVTGVLKEGNILYNVGCQEEITKEKFIDRIYNEDGGIEKHPYRVEYLKIIDAIEVYLSK